MEPMTLGSPNNSPAAGNNPYLPSFLMGDNPCTPSPRNMSSYSPKKRSLTFAQSPPPAPNFASASPELNRSTLGNKSLFSHNTSLSGPPIQGLFDSLHNEQNQIQSPTRNNNYQPNQSYQHSINVNQSVYNDSYLTSSGFNTPRVTSPTSYEYSSPPSVYMNKYPQSVQKYSDFWVTVFGFPQSATSLILTHFAQCGSVIDKVFPVQNGNWVHLKFSSCLEADRALNYNEKILANNIMIGVTRCKDSSIVDKENIIENYQPKARPLSQVAYNSAQNESAVVTSPNAPQRSTGLVNKAMDLLFGW